MNRPPIELSREAIHDLRGLSARFSAILALMEDPEGRLSLDAETIDRDFIGLLDEARRIWRQERNLIS